jgi:hypothetical protein
MMLMPSYSTLHIFLFHLLHYHININIHAIQYHVVQHSYDILGAGMLWKPKKARKFVKIRAEECFDKVLNEEF